MQETEDYKFDRYETFVHVECPYVGSYIKSWKGTKRMQII